MIQNRYVKVKGYDNWFLLLDTDSIIPADLSEVMQEKIMRSEVCKLHNPNAKLDFVHRVVMSATKLLDYEDLVAKYGSILVRQIGSFMMLKGNEIVAETTDSDFPIDEFADIVICENDSTASYDWLKYLNKRFPDKKKLTINFFDLRTENEVRQYFDKAEFITFSTTFTKFDWFEKLTKCAKDKIIIGYCHDGSKWKNALQINPNVEIVQNL